MADTGFLFYHQVSSVLLLMLLSLPSSPYPCSLQTYTDLLAITIAITITITITITIAITITITITITIAAIISLILGHTECDGAGHLQTSYGGK